MKKHLIFLLAFLTCFLGACSTKFDLPETVKIDGVSYQSAYNGMLYPTDEANVSNEAVIQGLCTFHRFDHPEYDCYITYNDSGEPVIYFAEDQFEAAKAYYDDPSNYRYYCMVGNIFEDPDVYEIPEMEPERLDALIAFCDKYDYDPTTSYQKTVETRFVPVQEDWTAGELRFRKESNDGCFSSGDHIFQLVDGALAMVYTYDLESENGYQMEIVDFPPELSDYFTELLKEVNISE